MTYYVAKQNHFNIDDSYAEGWNLCDSKGREIGARIRTFECVWEVRESRYLAAYATYEDAADFVYESNKIRRFAFCPQALRNGITYGACQSDRFFPTAEERDAAVKKYLADAYKRAAKAQPKKLAA